MEVIKFESLDYRYCFCRLCRFFSSGSGNRWNGGRDFGLSPYSPFPPLLYFLSTGAFLILACWISERAELLLGQKDSPKIVIDEVTGYLITMAFLPCTAPSIVGGFLFFRVLDIIKPPPANWINREMKGGWAVVLDDVVAGGYANILLRLTAVFFPDVFLT
jgi:phosphatidylglycerophosphatase A